jgi:hypothetical protein
MVQEAPQFNYARDLVSFFLRARRARAAARARAPSSDLIHTNSAILKVPDGALNC